MKRMYYSYIWPPIRVHIISKKLNVNKTYNPWDHLENNDRNENLPVDMAKLFKLAESGYFDVVKVCFDDTGNSAYYYDENDVIVELSGWVDLRQWENGGEITEDPNRKLSKEDFESKYRTLKNSKLKSIEK